MINLNFSQGLKGISCPVSLICGDKDTINKKATKNLSKNILKSEIQFIRNAKHEVNLDAPKELAEVLNDFYKRH